MLIIVNPIKVVGVTVDRSYSGNTSYIEGILRVIRCSFITSTTTFVLTINDSDGIPIYQSETMTGSLVEQIALAVRGTYTIVISDASRNEAFTCKLEVEE